MLRSRDEGEEISEAELEIDSQFRPIRGTVRTLTPADGISYTFEGLVFKRRDKAGGDTWFVRKGSENDFAAAKAGSPPTKASPEK